MHPFVLDPRNACFLMIDMQAKLLPAVAGHERVTRTSNLLVRSAPILGVPLLYTEHYPKGLGATIPELTACLPPDAHRFEKIHFSCCAERGFPELLEDIGRRQVVVWGIESHICVLTTVLELLRTGHDVVVAADGTGSRDDEHSRLALDAMLAAGALVVPAETAIYQLLQRAGTDTFKALLPLFK